MAAQKDQKSGGVVSVRQKDAFLTPPATMGFQNLVKPDEAFGEVKFKVNAHFNNAAAERLGQLIDAHIVDPLWDKFLAEVAKKEQESGKKLTPRDGFQKPQGSLWVEDHLKDAHPRSKSQDPYIIFSNDADYRDKDGVMHRKTMHGYDAANKDVDLAKANPWSGTIIQVMALAGLYITPLVKQPGISFKLQGVRILKLVGGGTGASGGASLGGIADEDMAMLDGEELSDLSAYAPAPAEEKATKGAAPRRQSSGAATDLDTELPF